MDIINILSNFTIQDMIIIILILIIIYLIFRHPKSNENFESSTVTPEMTNLINTTIQSQIQQIYDLDVEAMRNLGAISKTILTGANYSTDGTALTPGTLTIPANIVVLGSVTYNDTTGGNLASNSNTNISTSNISINKSNNIIKLGSSS